LWFRCAQAAMWASELRRTVYTPRRWDTTPRERAINGADPCPTSGRPSGTAHCPAAISVCMQACLCVPTTCPSQIFRWPLVSPWSASMSACAAARHMLRALRLPQPQPQPLPGPSLATPLPASPSVALFIHSARSVGLARPCTFASAPGPRAPHPGLACAFASLSAQSLLHAARRTPPSILSAPFRVCVLVLFLPLSPCMHRGSDSDSVIYRGACGVSYCDPFLSVLF
jgi:hypothetical protein